jgi:alanyl-tRNA synthetase
VPEHEVVAAVRKLTERVKELEKRPRESGRDLTRSLAERAIDLGGVKVLAEAAEGVDARGLRELSNEVRQALGDTAAVVLGSVDDGRVHLVANVSPSAVERGVKAGAVVGVAAQAVGGGGGGRDTLAQAGGRDPDKLPDALAAARLAVERALQ